MNKPTEAIHHFTPPWLWLWLAVYLVSLPTQVRLLQPRLAELFSATRLPGEAGNPFSLLIRAANILEVIPFLVVFLGVLLIFFPGLRARVLEVSYRLEEAPEALPAVQEIKDYLAEQAPGLEVSANLRRMDQLAFVYSRSHRRFAMALFGGLVRLWRADRPAALAVLNHEVAHYRLGDALVISAGHFFRVYLRFWLLVFLIFLLLPLLLAMAYGAFRSVSDTFQPQGLGVLFTYVWLLFSWLFIFFLEYLPAGLILFTSLGLWTVSVLVVPLFGIWSAELSADQYAVAATGRPADLRRALQRLSGKGPFWRRALAWVTHPPEALRNWLVRRPEAHLNWIILLLIFPSAYLIQVLALGAWGFTLYLSTGFGLAEAFAGTQTNILRYAGRTTPPWLLVGLGIVFWPLIQRSLEWIYRRTAVPERWVVLRGYLASGLLIGVFILSGASVSWQESSLQAGQPAPEFEQTEWTVGDRVEVEWQDSWYPAEILDVRDGLFYVHYEGYEADWDEWVDVSRVRLRSP